MGVKFLLLIDQRHPALPSIVGSVSGATSWFIAHSPAIASVAGAIGASATAAIAVISLARIVVRGITLIATAARQRLRNRAQRKAWKRLDPADDHLDFRSHD